MPRTFLVFIISTLVGCSTPTKSSKESWLVNFDKWEQDSGGMPHSVTRVSEPKRQAEDSLRFEVRHEDKIFRHGEQTFRSEVVPFSNPIPMGAEQWFGFSLYLPADFPIEDNRLVLAQWWAFTKKYLGEVSRSPALSLRYREGRLQVSMRSSDQRIIKDADSVPKTEIFSTNEFQLGKWNDFVFHMKWSYKADGFVEIWWNGEQVAQYKGPVGYNDDQGPLPKFGIYRDDSEKTYISFFSEYRRGNSFEEVDPSR